MNAKNNSTSLHTASIDSPQQGSNPAPVKRKVITKKQRRANARKLFTQLHLEQLEKEKNNQP